MAIPATDVDTIQCGKIRISAAGASVIDGRRTMIHVPSSDVRSVELVRAVPSQHPVATTIAGLVLAAIACSPIVMLVNAIRGAGPFRAVLIAAVGFAIPAWNLLHESLVARWVLKVRTPGGSK